MEAGPSTVSRPPNQLSFAINFFFENVYRWLSRFVEQNKSFFQNFCDCNTKYLKKFPQTFKYGYTSSHVPHPSSPFNIGITSALNRRPMYNLYATFVGDKAIESRPTLIMSKGNVST